MKQQPRQLLAFLLTVSLLLGSASFAFADTPPAATGSAVTAPAVFAADFTGTPVKLSLKEATRIMQTTGPGFELAEITKKLTIAASKGQREAYRALRDLSRHPDPFLGGANPDNTLEGKVQKVSEKHFASQAAISYEIAMKNLETETVKSYYGVLQAQESLRIARDNETIKKDILANTQKKLQLGTVAKVDLLTAQNAALEASSQTAAARTALDQARMAFNMQLGFPLMENVTFTDTLRKITPPAMSLDAAVASALANRNELNISRFNIEVARLELNSVFAYPKDSATYLGKQGNLMKAEAAYRNQLSSIEMEVRSKYKKLQNLSSEINVASAALENAKEGYRITKVSYDVGAKTLTDVQEAQNRSYMAQLNLSAKITEYDLAVYDFHRSVSFGGAQ